MGYYERSMNSPGGNVDNELSKEINRANKASKRNLLICVVLIIGFFIYSMVVGPSIPSVLMEKSYFAVMGLNKETTAYYFDGIQSVELRDSLESYDFGDIISGESSRRAYSGIFDTPEFGKCNVQLDKRVGNFLVIKTGAETLLLNYESEATTAEFMNSLLALREAALNGTLN